MARPAIITLGTIFTALNQNQDVDDRQTISWRNLMPFTKKSPEEKQEVETVDIVERYRKEMYDFEEKHWETDPDTEEILKEYKALDEKYSSITKKKKEEITDKILKDLQKKDMEKKGYKDDFLEKVEARAKE